MRTQKRLVGLFKNFVEKTCLQFLKSHEKLFKEWLYFSSLLSQEAIDFPKIQKYIDGLLLPVSPPTSLCEMPTVQSEIKTGSFDTGFLRKKQEIFDRYKQQGVNGGSLVLTGLTSQYKPQFQLPSPLEELSTLPLTSTQLAQPLHRQEIRGRLRQLLQTFEDHDSRLSRQSIGYYKTFN